MLLSVVIPVYGCNSCIVDLYKQLIGTLEKQNTSFEIILVNDACPDGSWKTIRELCHRDSRVKGLNFSRNFGQHSAIFAGLDIAKGDFVVVMDCDLQDDPTQIPQLYEKILQGYDIVLGRRIERRDRWIKRKSSELFYRLLGFLTDSKLDSRIANFGIYRSTVIKAVSSMGDRIRFFPAMVQWVGFSTSFIDIQHSDRHSGASAYSWKKLFQLAGNVILSFSNKPLKIIVGLGFMISIIAMIYSIFVFWKAMMGDISVSGWSSVIISIWFLSGIHMIVVGIVGIYIGKIFDNTKNRPLYIVKETINTESESST